MATPSSAEFIRQGTTYLQRPLLHRELARLSEVSWDERNRLIVDHILQRRNVAIEVSEINQMLSKAGYRGVDADLLYCKDSINRHLSNVAPEFRLTFMPDGNGRDGPYRFFRKKTI